MFFGHLNVRSLSQCVDEPRDLTSAASDKGGKVFLFCSESWLNEGIPDSFVSIHELRLFRRDRGAHGGGVAVYCSEDVNCVRRADLERNGLEALWVELKLNKKNVYWCVPSTVHQTVEIHPLKCLQV